MNADGKHAREIVPFGVTLFVRIDEEIDLARGHDVGVNDVEAIGGERGELFKLVTICLRGTLDEGRHDGAIVERGFDSARRAIAAARVNVPAALNQRAADNYVEGHVIGDVGCCVELLDGEIAGHKGALVERGGKTARNGLVFARLERADIHRNQCAGDHREP